MIFGLLLLAASMPQAGAIRLSPEAGIRADAALRRAWQGRRGAVERLCGEQSRLVRVQALDTRFGRVQVAYQARFGSFWNGQASVSESRLGMSQTSEKGAFSDQEGVDPRCVSPTAFSGALGEYQNGILLAEGELGLREGRIDIRNST